MNKKKMMDAIIKRYGFEAKVTIWFCGLCEKSNNLTYVKKVFSKIMKKSVDMVN